MSPIKLSRTPEYIEAISTLFTIYADWGKAVKGDTDRCTIASGNIDHEVCLLLFKGNKEDLEAAYQFIEKRKIK